MGFAEAFNKHLGPDDPGTRKIALEANWEQSVVVAMLRTARLSKKPLIEWSKTAGAECWLTLAAFETIYPGFPCSLGTRRLPYAAKELTGDEVDGKELAGYLMEFTVSNGEPRLKFFRSRLHRAWEEFSEQFNSNAPRALVVPYRGHNVPLVIHDYSHVEAPPLRQRLAYELNGRELSIEPFRLWLWGLLQTGEWRPQEANS